MSGSTTYFVSQINPTIPTAIRAYTADVRLNFRHAKEEIEELARQIEEGGGAEIVLPLSIADGGTGADNAADARFNLGISALGNVDGGRF